MGPTTRIGERAVLAGAVVAHRVGANELGPDGDLDGVTYDSDLDLATPVLVAWPTS